VSGKTRYVHALRTHSLDIIDSDGQYCENCHVSHIVPDDVTISAMSEGVRGYPSVLVCV
jgi:hypothetical protein